jgi:hypothetical protein
MKRKLAIASVALGLALMVLSLTMGTASASTGCFSDTNGNWAESFICWMKDNGITTGVTPTTYAPDANVTRAEMAAFLRRQVDVPPTQGQIQVVMDPTSWHPYGGGPLVGTPYGEYSSFHGATGPRIIDAFPTIPTALYGRSLSFSGVEICYFAGAVPITTLVVTVDAQAAGIETTNIAIPVNDTSVPTGDTCRNYTFPPVNLTAESIIDIRVIGNWTFAADQLFLGRATLVFQPTTTLAVSPSGPTMNTTATQP